MCGRFVLATPPDRLAEQFDARLGPDLEEPAAPSWNVAPTMAVLAVAIARDGERELGRYRWGLVPSFAKDPNVGNRMINARAESLDKNPNYRTAFARRRLLVLADGFYEWRPGPGKSRQPYYYVRSDGAPMAFAGLYELWREPAGDRSAPWLRSCTIVTTDAGPDVAPVHDRMPVLLEADAQALWLEAAADETAALESVLRPSPPGTLSSWPVDRRVGDARNDFSGLVEPVQPAEEAVQQRLDETTGREP